MSYICTANLTTMKLKSAISCIFILLASAVTAGNEGLPQVKNDFTEKYTVNFINMRDGLPHNFVDDIFRDSRGFVWIATSASLSRFDGYEFVNFTPNSSPCSIKSAFVRKMTEDRFRRLWVASDGGVDVIDIATLCDVTPLSSDSRFHKIISSPTDYISTDKEGNLWFRTPTQIHCISFDDEGRPEVIASIDHASRSTITTGAVKPVDGLDGGVLSGVAGKVCHLKLSGNRITYTPLSPSLKFDDIAYIADFIGYDGCIWTATDRGLYRFNPDTGNVTEYHGLPQQGTLSQNFVTTLAITPEGKLLAGTLDGFNLHNPTDDSFYNIRTSQLGSFQVGLNNNFINCLLTEGENIWIGTEGCGINLFSPKKLFATFLRHDSANPMSISPNPVNAIYEEGDGTLWVGTVEGGLNRAADGYSSGFSHFTSENGTLSHNSVSAITSDHAGHLWVGTWGGGLNMVMKSNPSKSLLKLHNVPGTDKPIEYIGALAYDPFHDYLWVGSNAGIYVYNIATGDMWEPFKGASKVMGSVAALVTPDGQLWIGGLDGLVVIDLKTSAASRDFSYKAYTYKLDNPGSNVKEKVTSIAQTHNGDIWVGTNGNGIYKFDNSGAGIFINFNSSDGLPNDVVHGIAEDPHGNLWVATYHGLACLTANGKTISSRNFMMSDGLDTEQFYWNAYCRLTNGEILFGSIDGLLAVKGVATGHMNKIYPVRFTSFAADSHRSFADVDEARLSEGNKSFEVAFSALNFASANTGRYLYRMKGYEDNWKVLPAGRHSVACMSLTPGTYSLEVKYVEEGQHADAAPVSTFRIEIVPYFYKRWWFMALIVAIAAIALWGALRWRLKDLKRQRNELKKAVEDGINAISGQKAVIEEHARELAQQNEELTLRNSQINEQKTHIAEMAREVQKLTADRISFFTNITHEFRTPITLIIGPIERALKLSTNPKVIEQLNFVERNSKYLLSLINQLMDFRKIESGKMDTSTRPGNIRDLIEDVTMPFRAYAEERGINVKTIYHLSNPVMAFNEDALRKVLTNLIGNAIKFTPDHGTVSVYAALFKSKRCDVPNTFYLCVNDTGCGIAEEDIDKIFGYFFQGKSQIRYPLIGASDSGIGLYLCRKLVEIYGGSISAHNNRGAGCSMRVLIPVQEEDLPQTPAEGTSTQENLTPHSPDTTTGNRRLTVLMVEDNDDMRAFMRSVLSDEYDVAEAANGIEALEKLRHSEIDFIISDLMMPGMDGLELAREVKNNFAVSHIPFVMLTAKTSQEARMEGYRNGVDDYILKPFNEEMLLTRIRNILANKRRYQRQFVTDMEVSRLNINEDSRDKKFVDKVMEVLRNNYSNSYFEVGEFAELLGVSRSLLNKKLQSLMGQSANQLMRSYRMKLAREMILKNRGTRNLNISEIAFEVGFNDSKYFTRCFTRHYGVTPSSVLKGEAQAAEPCTLPEDEEEQQLNKS